MVVELACLSLRGTVSEKFEEERRRRMAVAEPRLTRAAPGFVSGLDLVTLAWGRAARRTEEWERER